MSGEVSALIEHPETRFSFIDGVLQVVTCSINADTCPMSDKSLPALGGKSFEELRRTNQHGAEYWSARDLQPLLGYTQWRRFEQAIDRATLRNEEDVNEWLTRQKTALLEALKDGPVLIQ